MSPLWISLELRMMEVVVSTGAIIRVKLESNRHLEQTNTQRFTGRMTFLSPNQECQSTDRECIWFTCPGEAMVPISWCEMQCPVTFAKEFRKVARAQPRHCQQQQQQHSWHIFITVNFFRNKTNIIEASYVTSLLTLIAFLHDPWLIGPMTQIL